MNRLLLFLLILGGCSTSTDVFRDAEPNSGPESYSAWFADDDGRVLYFGTSPFWTLWWERDGDPLADLERAGDLVIGRFDLERERFLAPLVVGSRFDGVRSSVWDVLAHSGGRIYFTTFYESAGSVRADGLDVERYPALGPGLNELVEGPAGRIYATRYSDSPARPSEQRMGSIVVFDPDGTLVAEHAIPALHPGFVAPKSLAVDPTTREIWLNTDSFLVAGEAPAEPVTGAEGGAPAEPSADAPRIVHERIRLDSRGRILERTSDGPELMFVAFDRSGRGWFAEDDRGRLQLRVREDGVLSPPIALGERAPLDFVQDIRFTPRGGALLALWSGRVIQVEPRPRGGHRVVDLQLELPPSCAPPRRALLYTAVRHQSHVYATLFCGPTLLRARVE